MPNVKSFIWYWECYLPLNQPTIWYGKVWKFLTWSLKVSKSQKHFFLKLYCPKNERNINKILPYEAKVEFCLIFRSFFGQWRLKKRFCDLLTFSTYAAPIKWANFTFSKVIVHERGVGKNKEILMVHNACTGCLIMKWMKVNGYEG
jgi:hypothetical protein